MRLIQRVIPNIVENIEIVENMEMVETAESMSNDPGPELSGKSLQESRSVPYQGLLESKSLQSRDFKRARTYRPRAFERARAYSPRSTYWSHSSKSARTRFGGRVVKRAILTVDQTADEIEDKTSPDGDENKVKDMTSLEGMEGGNVHIGRWLSTFKHADDHIVLDQARVSRLPPTRDALVLELRFGWSSQLRKDRFDQSARNLDYWCTAALSYPLVDLGPQQRPTQPNYEYSSTDQPDPGKPSAQPSQVLPIPIPIPVSSQSQRRKSQSLAQYQAKRCKSQSLAQFPAKPRKYEIDHIVP
uniref:Uncharacterized protein n=1 Tax=Timema bartmani TaxID=61472 RepID=A0A7R9F394_9NEOP|nr:unnamed protein product [Timema bartmani]